MTAKQKQQQQEEVPFEQALAFWRELLGFDDDEDGEVCQFAQREAQKDPDSHLAVIVAATKVAQANEVVDAAGAAAWRKRWG